MSVFTTQSESGVHQAQPVIDDCKVDASQAYLIDQVIENFTLCASQAEPNDQFIEEKEDSYSELSIELRCQHTNKCYCKRPLYNLYLEDRMYSICIEPLKCRSQFARKNVRIAISELLCDIDTEVPIVIWQIVVSYWYSPEESLNMLMLVPITEKEKKKSSTSIKKVRMTVEVNGIKKYKNVPETENMRRKITSSGSYSIKHKKSTGCL